MVWGIGVECSGFFSGSGLQDVWGTEALCSGLKDV